MPREEVVVRITDLEEFKAFVEMVTARIAALERERDAWRDKYVEVMERGDAAT